MRVAMIQDDWWPTVGGGPVHVKNLATSLAEDFGCEVDIYTRKIREKGQIYDDRESYADGRVTVHRVGPTTTYYNPVGRLLSAFSLVPVRRLHEYDVVHGHTYLPAVPTKLTQRLSNTPSVFTIHGTALNSEVGLSHSTLVNRVERIMERRFILGFDYDHVISVNREHLPMLERHHDAVSYIPNGVDVDRFDVERDPVEGRILYLGRLAREKRVEDLIRAMPAISERWSEAELVVVGTGPERERLEAVATELGVSDVIRFEGRVSDEAVVRHYSSAEAFVLPSIWEGHPLTLLEAWAAGVPVIATDVEGITEFVDHERNGLLVPPRSPDAIASAIDDVFDDRQKAEALGRRAKRQVYEEYTWTECARKVNEIYERITRRTP